tara:strand:- start:668 stop:877 length:210 start_codon:yes stop_codon:yes gene_type:complete
MIPNKKKFLNGLQKIVLASISLIGPIIFTLKPDDSIYLITGTIIMIIGLLIGIWGIKDLLSGFFDKPNE